MQRIAVIGNAGGGKTTLCNRLGLVLNIPVYFIDKIQWKPGWEAASAQEFAAQHDSLLPNKQWIIDGWGPWEAIIARFEASDTIIVIDLPLFIHYYWSFKRQISYLFRPRPDLPANCPSWKMNWKLIQTIWYLHYQMRSRLLELATSFSEHKQIVILRSPRAIRLFLSRV